MFSRRVWLWVGLAALILGAVGLWMWQRNLAAQAAAQGQIRQEVVGRGSILATVSATGNLAPQQQVNLFFSGAATQPVVEVYVTLGQRVAAGDPLARLDDRALTLAVLEAEQALAAAQLDLEVLTAPPRPEDVAVAEANLRVARSQAYAASLGNSPEQVEIARLNLVIAQNNLNQTYATMDRLIEQDRWAEKNALQAQADRQVEEAQIADLRYHAAQEAPPYGPVAQAQAAVAQAEAALEALQRGASAEDIEIAELRISQAEAALELAQLNLENATLRAPFDGVVAAVNLRVGEPPSALRPAVVLADVSGYYLDVAVDEVDVARVVPGQPVTVTLDALPDLLLAGVVEKIAPAATINQGVVNYAVRVTLAEGAAAQGVRGGMTATAAIVVDEVDDAVLVPNWAIRRDRNTGQIFVGVLRDGVIRDVPVELGLRDELYSEVLSGVQPGDVVAVSTARQTFSLFGD